MINRQTISDLKKTGIVIWLLLSLVIFIILFFLIWVCFEKIKKESNKLFSQKNTMSILESQNKETEEFKSNYEGYMPNLQKIDHFFVNPQDPLDFIKFLEQSAHNANVELEISPLSFSEEGDLKALSFQLISEGAISNILNFLKRIEKGPYLLSIKNLTIANFDSPKPLGKNLSKETQANFSIKVLTQ